MAKMKNMRNFFKEDKIGVSKVALVFNRIPSGLNNLGVRKKPNGNKVKESLVASSDLAKRLVDQSCYGQKG